MFHSRFLPIVFCFSMILGVGFSAEAQRGRASGGSKNIKLNLSLFKYDTQTEGANLGTGESKTTLYDIKLGYHFSHYYLGLIYNSRDLGQDTRTASGASLGYHSGGYFLDLSYYISATRDRGSSVLEKGTGYGVDWGYNAGLSSSVYIGVQASYKSFSYTERDGLEEENKEISEIYPMLNLGFVF